MAANSSFSRPPRSVYGKPHLKKSYGDSVVSAGGFTPSSNVAATSASPAPLLKATSAEILIQVTEQHAGRHGGDADGKVVPAVRQSLALARHQLRDERLFGRFGQRVKQRV